MSLHMIALKLVACDDGNAGGTGIDVTQNFPGS